MPSLEWVPLSRSKIGKSLGVFPANLTPVLVVELRGIPAFRGKTFGLAGTLALGTR